MKTFFELLPQASKDRVLQAARRRSFPDGACIQSRDRHLRRVCVISEGRVRFSNVTLHGQEIDTALLEPGQSFGEITTFAGRPPAHDAFAVGPVRLEIVDWPLLQTLVSSDRAIADTFLKAMASMLMDALEAIDDLRSLPPLALVAKHLLHSTPAQSRQLAISQTALAARLGCSRSTLSKSLQALQRIDAIKIRYGAIEIVDASRLTRFAQAEPRSFAAES